MRKSNGFTLVEVAIVLLVLSVIAAGFLAFANNFMGQAKIRDLRTDMNVIAEGINAYVEVNGKLPCPADSTAMAETVDFGREVDADCNTVAAGAGIIVTGDVVIGALPTRSLNLPDKYLIDPWGTRYLYAVSAQLASTAIDYDPANASISVEDSAGNSLINPAGGGAYVVVSLGSNRQGGFTASGIASGVACDLAATEGENCDGDATFRNTLFSRQDGVNYFDDYLLYRTANMISPEIPSGAVMAFDRPCPVGWTDYLPARGRVIIGSLPLSQTYTTINPAAIADNIPVGSGIPYVTGDTGGSALRADSDPLFDSSESLAVYDNRPPFVALRYCRKN